MPHAKGLSTLDAALSDPGFLNVDVPGRPDLTKRFRSLAPVRAEKRQTNIATQTLEDLLGEASSANKILKSISLLPRDVKEGFIPKVFRTPEKSTKVTPNQAELTSIGTPDYQARRAELIARGAPQNVVLALDNADRQAQSLQIRKEADASRNLPLRKLRERLEFIETTGIEEITPELETELAQSIRETFKGTSFADAIAKAFSDIRAKSEKKTEEKKEEKPEVLDTKPAPAAVLPEAGKPDAESRVLDFAGAQALLNEVGGDKDKARSLARERGFSF